ncbi:hypothetical protein CMI37_36860 [Candidatus Pacearchaeota archaeon]|nr:hypothetical protein [Candidatus Pacearchaeota archaeon]|tara:strand:+ start:5261 stop:6223 length:963 start_codon:yes stop_codon:yes gene_type:complete
MAYQNVATPRFYVNMLEWLDSVGYSTGLDNLFRTLPVDPVGNGLINTPHSLSLTAMTDNGFMAILGHDLPIWENYAYLNSGETAIVLSNVVNSSGGSTDHLHPDYNGFSIATFSGYGVDAPNVDSFNLVYAESSYIGSVIIGTYYDMPHSPELKLTMSREMDGVKRIRTKGGADLVNHKYTKPAMWGDAGAWELYEGTPTNQALSRSGRRSWDLSFSYLRDSDMFPDVSSLANYETISPDGTTWNDEMNATDNTLLNEDTFYSQVIHKTNGGQLPFIFQPDNANNNIDGWAIAKFDMNSFKFSQVSKNIYDIKIKIREVW